MALAVAFSLLFIAPKILSRRPIAKGEVMLGAIVGAVALVTITNLAGLITARFLNNSSAVYGAMTTVVAFISVLFLSSNAVVFSYEMSVVWAWQLWPRGLDINTLFPADERAYGLLSPMDERMPSQRNGVYFDATGHDDPRRTDLESLMRRPEGVAHSPYDGATDRSQRPGVEVRRAARAALLGFWWLVAPNNVALKSGAAGLETSAGGGDLNSHVRGHRNLNPARLPIPPHPRSAPA